MPDVVPGVGPNDSDVFDGHWRGTAREVFQIIEPCNQRFPVYPNRGMQVLGVGDTQGGVSATALPYASTIGSMNFILCVTAFPGEV